METIHKGLHTHRLSKNPLEKKFADEWNQMNEQSYVLEYILAKESNHPRGEMTDRDAEVAATVIQWLGSNVGQCFLNTVLEHSENNS
jgi:hypothetical protein